MNIKYSLSQKNILISASFYILCVRQTFIATRWSHVNTYWTLWMETRNTKVFVTCEQR